MPTQPPIPAQPAPDPASISEFDRAMRALIRVPKSEVQRPKAKKSAKPKK